jgi:predicted transcriptional regulator
MSQNRVMSRDRGETVLSPEQLQALELLSSGHSQVSVANLLGVSRRTVVRWMSKPEFKQALTGLGSNQFVINQDAIEPEIIQPQESQLSIRERLNSLIPSIIDECEAILLNPDTRDSDKLKSAALLAKWAGLEDRPNNAVLAFDYLINEGIAPLEIARFYAEMLRNVETQMQVKLGGNIEA